MGSYVEQEKAAGSAESQITPPRDAASSSYC